VGVQVINLNDTSPAAPTNSRNGKWQKGATTGNDPTYGVPIFPVSVNMPDMVGDTGSGGADGLVPAPPAGSAAAGKFLKADGTFQMPPGGVSVAGITIDGGGLTLATGTKGFFQVPYSGTITGWTLLADVSGSAVLTVKKSTYAGFPTTTSIVASAPPTLSSQQKATSTTLTGWTTAITADDVLEYDLTSATTVTRITLELQITRS
jgi:hypothetical protein